MTEQDAGSPFVPDAAVCPICRNTIRLADESFLELCYHRFCFHCICKAQAPPPLLPAPTAPQADYPLPRLSRRRFLRAPIVVSCACLCVLSFQWTDAQAQLHKSSSCGSSRPSFACPLCKGIYSYILYDVLDTHSFRRRFVPGGSRAGSISRGPSQSDEVYALNSAQRRRRGLYFAPPPSASPSSPASHPRYEYDDLSSASSLPDADDDDDDARVITAGGGGRKARPMTRLGPAALRTHHEAWLKRELQVGISALPRSAKPYHAHPPPPPFFPFVVLVVPLYGHTYCFGEIF